MVEDSNQGKVKLSDFGITKDQSSTFQKIAAAKIYSVNRINIKLKKMDKNLFIKNLEAITLSDLLLMYSEAKTDSVEVLAELPDEIIRAITILERMIITAQRDKNLSRIDCKDKFEKRLKNVLPS